MTSLNSDLGRNRQQHAFTSFSYHIDAGNTNDPKSVPDSKMQWNNYKVMSYKHFFPFKSIIYLILNLYNLIVSNGCFQQPAYKIPKNVTVCFCRPMRADSSIPLLMLYHLLGSRGFLSQFKLCHAFVYLYNFSLYKLTFLRMPVWLSHFFFFLGHPHQVLLQKSWPPSIQKLLNSWWDNCEMSHGPHQRV